MKKVLSIILVIMVIIGIAGVAFWYFWSFWSSKKTYEAQSKQYTQIPPSQTPSIKFAKKVFFIHHSTGEIYWKGGLEKSLKDAGYEAAAPWWDAGTDPGDFYADFSDPNQWKILEPYSIIIFKSCFPASNITSTKMLGEYKNNYNKLYEIYRAHPDKLFVPLSTPPLLKNHTTPAAAQRAFEFEYWLMNDYKNNYDGKNLAPLGLHSLLSDTYGYLMSDFIASDEDDHPNNYSGEVVGPAIVIHLSSWVKE